MSVSVKVTKDLSRIPKKLKTMNERGQYALANQVHADMNNYVPFLSGDLRNQSSIAIDGKSVHYNTPYARAQFYGFVGKGHHRVYRYSTPGTSRRWDLRAKAVHRGSWERITKAAMR